MIKVLFTEAVFAVAANKSRTLLTLLGVVIGIASVITVVAAGEGGKSIIMKEFEGLSPSTLQIMPNWQVRSMNRAYRTEPVTRRDLDDLEEFAPHVRAIAPLQSIRGLIEVGSVKKQLRVTGSNSNYVEFVEYELDSGRIITDGEVERQEKVAIIGYTIKEEFFEGRDPVGEYITVFGIPIKVVGVLKRKEKADTISISDPDDGYNNAILVPISLFKRLFGRDDRYYNVLCKAVSMDDIPRARNEILSVLNKNHGLWEGGESKYMVQSMQEQLDMITTVVGTITIGVAVLAGIALLVAAIGIMNIMLVSVKERTREIGIRKALGAKRKHIMGQFLIEALLVCGGGGIVGLGFAAIAAQVIARLAKWPVIIDPGIAAFSILLALFTGLASGLYPAGRAAKLVPHEALRYE
jgi:putative ABC transport system permease protein